MFMLWATGLIAAAVLWNQLNNKTGRPAYESELPENRIWILVLHIRQDLQFICYLLIGVIIMLGIIAEGVR
jgi:hypothetical protein